MHICFASDKPCAPDAADNVSFRGAGASKSQLSRFIGIGGIATVIQLGMFAGLALITSTVWANIISWTLSTVVANRAHRSVTFKVHDKDSRQRDLSVAAAFSLVALVASTLVLATVDTNGTMSLIVLISVNGAVGVARYVALRWWFGKHQHSPVSAPRVIAQPAGA
ncbi:GtrA family protein [Nakamurella antarctica]|uniref:GtrA family protein n=1 Tax=Nakamurella antarctica TaxID=1902245 RepID=A0A3G8ZJD0_9ACTN|nr:GtrA family protein [Nakamurella antarctica]AZI56945.1 GtrA family protein [Nakamurella antarctica]